LTEEQSILLNRHPELRELVKIIRDEVQRHQRPANETILFDEDLMKILGVSKRKIEYMKANREIPYRNPPMQRDYYILAEILEWLDKYRVESISSQRKI
jgi:hypothetical protein